MLTKYVGKFMTAPISFTADNHLTASAEGWDIFETDSGELQLQRVDEQNIFANDDTAWEHVITQAVAGSTFHQHTVAYLKQASPSEYANFVKDAKVKDEGDKAALLLDSGEAIPFPSKDDATAALAHYRKALSFDS
tara:strand:+ start:11906 stop:12313 length:408 start_codon:yes stop_codon:yes gene_type:complete